MNLRPRFSATVSNFYLHFLLSHLGLHLFPPLHLPEQLSKLHWAFPQTCPEPIPEHTTKPQTLKFHLAHPCFELCRNSSPGYSAHCRKSVSNQCPKKNTTKPQTPRFHLTHPCFELCRNSSPSYTADYQPWISCLQESYTTTHFCKAIHYGPKKQRDKHRDPCVQAMSLDVFWCLSMCSNIFK